MTKCEKNRLQSVHRPVMFLQGIDKVTHLLKARHVEKRTREGTAFCIGGQILQGLNAKQRQHAEKNMLEANDVIAQLTNREAKIISTVLSEMVVFNWTGGFGTLRAWRTVGQ